MTTDDALRRPEDRFHVGQLVRHIRAQQIHHERTGRIITIPPLDVPLQIMDIFVVEDDMPPTPARRGMLAARCSLAGERDEPDEDWRVFLLSDLEPLEPIA